MSHLAATPLHERPRHREDQKESKEGKTKTTERNRKEVGNMWTRAASRRAPALRARVMTRTRWGVSESRRGRNTSARVCVFVRVWIGF